MEKCKKGALVYPVLRNGLNHVELFSCGIFFTDINKGWEYEKQMNAVDTEFDYWTNKIIQYDLDLDEMNAKVEQVVDRLLSK